MHVDAPPSMECQPIRIQLGRVMPLSDFRWMYRRLPVDSLAKVPDARLIHLGRLLALLGQHRRKGRGPAWGIERLMTVRHDKQQLAAESQRSSKLSNHSQRVGDMLNHMGGDDTVQRT